MKIIILDDLSFVSSSVTGSAYAEYAAATTYALGDKKKVSFESDGTTPRWPVYEYESLAGSNVGNYPPDSPGQWAELGAENRCKMFDDYTNTQTEDTTDIEVVLNANGFDSIGLFGIVGKSVTLKLVKDSVTKKEETFDLRTFIPESGWYSWLFDSFEYGISQILWNFPKYATGATIDITIEAVSSFAACGMVVMGVARTLGITIFEPKIGIDDYSIKDTDTLGRTYLSQGNYAKRSDITMYILNKNIDYVARQLTAIRGVPAIFDLNNADGTSYQSLAIYGYTQNFDILIPGPIRSKCSLEIKGLI